MPSRDAASATVLTMSTASVLIAADSTTPTAGVPRYTLLLSTDPELIEAAQRLRHDVFTSEPGFALAGATDGRDADRFDEYCDHLLVREDNSGELVGCYRMLPPPGAIAAGGLYTATEFDVGALDPLRPVARRDGASGGARRSPQRRRRAADVGGHPGLSGPLRLRLRHRLRVSARARRRRRGAGQPDPRRARLRPAQTRRARAVHRASLPAGDDRRQGPRRHRPAGAGSRCRR